MTEPAVQCGYKRAGDDEQCIYTSGHSGIHSWDDRVKFNLGVTTMPSPFQPMSLGFVIALIVLVLCIVLAVVQGPSIALGLIGALALARMV